MFAFFWTQNSHARTRTRFRRVIFHGVGWLARPSGNLRQLPRRGRSSRTSWALKAMRLRPMRPTHRIEESKDSGFGKINLWCISMMYSSRQWPTDLIHGRFYQMAWSLCSFHILSPLPKTHPSGFKIPKDCRCSAFLKLSEVWWNF